MSKILLYIYTLYYSLLTKFFAFLCIRKKAYKDILFLENFPIENAGYQYRAKKWQDFFTSKGLSCEVKTLFESKEAFENEFNEKNLSAFFIKTMKIRFKQILSALEYRTVIVRRELLLFNDYGDLFMEKFLLKIHPNAILDFDDDIAAAKKQPRKITNLYGKLLFENGNKFNDSLRLYKRFIVGSDYLKQRVLTENTSISADNICVIPTCVDYEKYEPRNYANEQENIVIGWLGGNQNLHLLDILTEALNKLSKKHKVKLLVVAGADYVNKNAKFEIENQWWTLETEKEQIKQFDIGIMPIYDDARSRGKCGFKLIQYMGMGVVSIATNVTINGEIIDDGVNGFLINPDNCNWYEVLEKAISMKDFWQQIGSKAQQTIKESYSFKANEEKYLKFLEIVKQQQNLN